MSVTPSPSGNEVSPSLPEKSIVSPVEEENYVPDSAKHFNFATAKVLKSFISKITFPKLVATYPECSGSGDEFLNLHHQFVDQLADKIKQDLETICRDQNLIQKLAELDKLKKQAESFETDTTWRPSGNPIEDIRDHRYQQKLKHKQVLENNLQDLQSQNNNLEQEVMENHTRIMSLKEKIVELDKLNKSDIASLRLLDLKRIEDLERNLED